MVSGRPTYVVQSVLEEAIPGECHLERIRKKAALVRQAGLVEALFDLCSKFCNNGIRLCYRG